ncbi:MAG: TA system VapC family ribonuclease toxin [Verrucomicrobiales bacterium]
MSASLLDTNVWVAATFTSHPYHAASMDVLRVAKPSQPALICRATELGFLRLITSARLVTHYGATGMTNRHALAALSGLKTQPGIKWADEPLDAVPLWHRLADRETASSKVWMDAYLAAFAIAGRLHFVTLDADFKTYEAHGLQLALLTPS